MWEISRHLFLEFTYLSKSLLSSSSIIQTRIANPPERNQSFKFQHSFPLDIKNTKHHHVTNKKKEPIRHQEQSQQNGTSTLFNHSNQIHQYQKQHQRTNQRPPNSPSKTTISKNHTTNHPHPPLNTKIQSQNKKRNKTFISQNSPYSESKASMLLE